MSSILSSGRNSARFFESQIHQYDPGILVASLPYVKIFGVELFDYRLPRDMTSLTTEDFPYTIDYVMELLGLNERELMLQVQTFELSPTKDEKTGRLIFSYRDIEVLKKAMDMKRHGDDPSAIARQLGRPASGRHIGQQASQNPEPTGKSGYLSPSGASHPTRQASSALSGKDNITIMVEAVSQVKEGILKDLSRLLDDKLSGLDEVVVELIRCKSENDSLRKKLDDAVRSKETLEHELSRFKPVQFGFYRKT